MLLIETFMLDPAKLATNWVRASGNSSFRRAEAFSDGVFGGIARQVWSSPPTIPSRRFDARALRCATPARYAPGEHRSPFSWRLRDRLQALRGEDPCDCPSVRKAKLMIRRRDGAKLLDRLDKQVA